MSSQPTTTVPAPVAPVPASPRAGTVRVHYLDWLRVLALLGVFLYHAVHPFDTLDWHVKNADQSELISVVLAFFSAWGLGLFFLLAGAGTFFSLRSRSAGGYAAERVSRLLVPLLVAWVLLSPPQGFIEGRHQGTWSGSYLQYLPHFFDDATQWAMSGRPGPTPWPWPGPATCGSCSCCCGSRSWPSRSFLCCEVLGAGGSRPGWRSAAPGQAHRCCSACRLP